MEVMSRAMVEKKDIFMQGRMIAGGLNISIIVHHALDGARQAGSGKQNADGGNALYHQQISRFYKILLH